MFADMCRLLRCPTCRRGSLKIYQPATQAVIEDGSLCCECCSATFPVVDGVPVFLPHFLRARSSDSNFSTLDNSTRQKILQREWHDHAHLDGEEEYKNSTYTDQGLFAFLLYYQLREVEAVLTTAGYSCIANIGCGHGFELDYLSLLGKRVILADISLKSLQKALRRGTKLGIHVEALCCDAENLPLHDDICDLALTHHSLHHLDNPIAGLEEMIRICNSRIAFFEPAKGLMRTIVRASGLKPRVEEAGNVVYEFSLKGVREICRKKGAALRYFRKCLITGPTSAPRMFKQLDASRVTPVICSSITFANRLLGSVIGTKCSVVIDKTTQPGRLSNREFRPQLH